MTALEALMRRWLAAGTEPQRRHAAYRLTRPFHDENDPPPAPPPPPATDGVPCPWRRTEPDAGCCGPADVCRAPGHRLFGRRVMSRDCLACVAAGERPETPE